MIIKPIYISFDTAKLLRDKKCEINGCREYFTTGEMSENNDPKKVFIEAVNKNKIISCIAPEQWQIIEWLRIKHNIWIYSNNISDDRWYAIAKDDKELTFSSCNEKGKILDHKNGTWFNSSSEAIEFVIHHIFKNIL